MTLEMRDTSKAAPKKLTLKRETLRHLNLAEWADPERNPTVPRMTLRYARYALAALAVVGFGSQIN